MLSRRDFLKRSVVVVSAGLALPPIFTKAASASADSAAIDPAFRDRILVVVQMAGGNDGLNTIVPYLDGHYRDLRSNIGIPVDQVLPLDGSLGLHPSLAGLRELWDDGVLGIVQGVGYPNPSLSHFRAMEIWQTAKPDQGGSDGWLGRYFQHVIDEDGHLLDGVAVGNLMPMALRGAGSNVATVERLESYKLQNDQGFPGDAAARLNALLNLYAKYPNRAPYAALFQETATKAYRSTEELQQAAADYTPAVTYPSTPLGTGLKLLAQAINADLGIKVFHIGVGGFDTHANQLFTQARLLKTLGDGLNAFYKDLEGHGKAQNVLVMTWSEFGRRAQENANRGTDHGTAGPMFLVGSLVQRGLYGETPSLARLRDENLSYTVDFRSVYATVLGDWMGAPVEDVLGGPYEQLPLFTTAPQLPAVPSA